MAAAPGHVASLRWSRSPSGSHGPHDACAIASALPVMNQTVATVVHTSAQAPSVQQGIAPHAFGNTHSSSSSSNPITFSCYGACGVGSSDSPCAPHGTGMEAMGRGWLASGPLGSGWDGFDQRQPQVLRERDWGGTDLFSSLRTQFASSALASIGGSSAVQFIAPVEHMKQVLTLPYSKERVAFPVHRVGDALVIDGAIRGSELSDALAGSNGRAHCDDQALADALGQMGLLTQDTERDTQRLRSGGLLQAPQSAATAALAPPGAESLNARCSSSSSAVGMLNPPCHTTTAATPLPSSEYQHPALPATDARARTLMGAAPRAAACVAPASPSYAAVTAQAKQAAAHEMEQPARNLNVGVEGVRARQTAAVGANSAAFAQVDLDGEAAAGSIKPSTLLAASNSRAPPAGKAPQADARSTQCAAACLSPHLGSARAAPTHVGGRVGASGGGAAGAVTTRDDAAPATQRASIVVHAHGRGEGARAGRGRRGTHAAAGDGRASGACLASAPPPAPSVPLHPIAASSETAPACMGEATDSTSCDERQRATRPTALPAAGEQPARRDCAATGTSTPTDAPSGTNSIVPETRWTFWSADACASPGASPQSGTRANRAPAAHSEPVRGGANAADAAGPEPPSGRSGAADGSGAPNLETRWTYWAPSPLVSKASSGGGSAALRRSAVDGQTADMGSAASLSQQNGEADGEDAGDGDEGSHGCGGGAAQLAARRSDSGSALGTGHGSQAQGHAAQEGVPLPFRQVVHWQLRNLGMLIGTNQLLFASHEHPTMSLRLCDMTRPLTSLSVLDFWLDNVMGNVPAVAVCGHIAGAVHGYRVVKTEDLPHWPGAGFDEGAVLDNAHAMLSFLHAHCTRPGGSYWVLKEPEADFIRVFDLKALCGAAARAAEVQRRQGDADGAADAHGGLRGDGKRVGAPRASGVAPNPFGRAVSLMSFRMAQRPQGSAAERRELLAQCVELISAAEMPLLWSVAHAQLAESEARRGEGEGEGEGDSDVWGGVCAGGAAGHGGAGAGRAQACTDPRASHSNSDADAHADSALAHGARRHVSAVSGSGPFDAAAGADAPGGCALSGAALRVWLRARGVEARAPQATANTLGHFLQALRGAWMAQAHEMERTALKNAHAPGANGGVGFRSRENGPSEDRASRRLGSGAAPAAETTASELLSEVPELSRICLPQHRSELAISFSLSCLDFAGSLHPAGSATTSIGQTALDAASAQRATAGAKLLLLRSAATALLAAAADAAESPQVAVNDLPVPSSPPSPLVTLPTPGCGSVGGNALSGGGSRASHGSHAASPAFMRVPNASLDGAEALSPPFRVACAHGAGPIMLSIAQLSGDALMELERSGALAATPEDGSVDSVTRMLTPLHDWLQLCAPPDAPKRFPVCLLPGTATLVPRGTAQAMADACAIYWWALQLSAALAPGKAPHLPLSKPGGHNTGCAPPSAKHAHKSARSSGSNGAGPVHAEMSPLSRRLGAVLNELGRHYLCCGELAKAETCFKDSFTSFAFVDDAPNKALVLINFATVSRTRSTLLRAERERAAEKTQRGGLQGASQSAVASGLRSELAPRSDELDELAAAVQQQRRAVEAIRPLRTSQPRFWAQSLKQLAEDEAEMGGTLLQLLSHGSGTEAAVRQAGDALSRAQAINEELGEAAQVQLMMRLQGTLYLQAAKREQQRAHGNRGERAPAGGSSKLTLAFRHLERASSPSVLAGASASMLACAARCQLELASFYLSLHAPRLRELEAALAHARAARRLSHLPRSDRLGAELANAEERALLEILRLHKAAANTAQIAAFKEEYRQVLSERAKYEANARGQRADATAD